MWEDCFSVELPKYTTILAIEGAIEHFESDIPSAFAPIIGAEVDQSKPYLFYQVRPSLALDRSSDIFLKGQVLRMEIYHARLLLLVSTMNILVWVLACMKWIRSAAIHVPKP